MRVSGTYELVAASKVTSMCKATSPSSLVLRSLVQSRRSRSSLVALLEGNIDGAERVELQQTGVLTGDLKAASLVVAAGSRMRGQVEFGWENKPGVKGSAPLGHGSG